VLQELRGIPHFPTKTVLVTISVTPRLPSLGPHFRGMGHLDWHGLGSQQGGRSIAPAMPPWPFSRLKQNLFPPRHVGWSGHHFGIPVRWVLRALQADICTTPPLCPKKLSRVTILHPFDLLADWKNPLPSAHRFALSPIWGTFPVFIGFGNGVYADDGCLVFCALSFRALITDLRGPAFCPKSLSTSYTLAPQINPAGQACQAMVLPSLAFVLRQTVVPKPAAGVSALHHLLVLNPANFPVRMRGLRTVCRSAGTKTATLRRDVFSRFVDFRFSQDIRAPTPGPPSHSSVSAICLRRVGWFLLVVYGRLKLVYAR